MGRDSRARGRPGLRMMPRLGIVVPSRNAAATIGSTLGALREIPGVEADVIVVDGHSEDGTADLASAMGARPRRHLRRDQCRAGGGRGRMADVHQRRRHPVCRWARGSPRRGCEPRRHVRARGLRRCSRLSSASLALRAAGAPSLSLPRRHEPAPAAGNGVPPRGVPPTAWIRHAVAARRRRRFLVSRGRAGIPLPEDDRRFRRGISHASPPGGPAPGG
ncbi:MAG: glycosyltransferase [Planctomycetia bacterium]|nr:glycosyltransferase [Planctomycetia bacterium]